MTVASILAISVPPTDLPELIRNAYTQGSERKVYLKADARAKYANVERAIGLIRQSGIQEVALLAEDRPQPKP